MGLFPQALNTEPLSPHLLRKQMAHSSCLQRTVPPSSLAAGRSLLFPLVTQTETPDVGTLSSAAGGSSQVGGLQARTVAFVISETAQSCASSSLTPQLPIQPREKSFFSTVRVSLYALGNFCPNTTHDD